jgi:glutaminyl-peptide cyclotransferase
MRAFALVIAASLACSAQAPPQSQVPQSQASQALKFDGNRAFQDLQEQVAIGPRPAGSEGIKKTRDYIKQQLSAAGLTPIEQAFEARTPTGAVQMVNIRATLPGQAQNRGRIVIGSHYDTKLVKEFKFVGASDGASSTAFLLELARALKGRVNPMPIELLFLDGEEAVVDWNLPNFKDHTYGSRYYVEQLKKTGTVKDVRAFILIDMIGDKNLDIHREGNSTPWLTDEIWAAAKRLNRPEFHDDVFPVEDDHLEFLDAGIASVDLIDLQNYPPWHTAEDTLDKVAASSLQVVGDVLLAALPAIEARLASNR